MEFYATDEPHLLTKLIFNPSAGVVEDSPKQLLEVIQELQAWNFTPEPYLVKPDCDVVPVIQDALQRGIKLIVVGGGDGTVENVAGSLIGQKASLGIIPTGTRNNVAFSLAIPEDIPAAVALLRTGQPAKVDVGLATCGQLSHYFLETCSVGLLSAIFPAADEIQHGNLSRIGDFLATLFAYPAAEMDLVIAEHQKIHTTGHVVLVANLPYVGPHFKIVPAGVFNDGLLDLLIFPELSKLDLLSNAAWLAGGGAEDPRIQRYQVQRVEITTNPPMPVMADGFSLGEGPLAISVQHCGLTVIAGKPAPTLAPGNCLTNGTDQSPNQLP